MTVVKDGPLANKGPSFEEVEILHLKKKTKSTVYQCPQSCPFPLEGQSFSDYKQENPRRSRNLESGRFHEKGKVPGGND